MSKILEQAKALVDDIYNSMTKVETCETLSEAVSEQEVVLVNGGSDRYVKLDGVLTEEQMQDVKKYIQNTIDSNKAEAERFLLRVSGKDATINQDFEDAVQEMINSNPVEPEKEVEPAEPVEIERPEEKQYPDLTVEEVRKVYTEGEMTIVEAADYFGIDRNKLYRFITDHGLRKPKKDNTPWRTSSHK
ncbi:MAG: hypothetical protein SPG09_12770 [Lachnospiraceae bacterium]|nr:hypothetical protein [bacterium]MDY5518462.1 hypothetical protein [Lachnospiraceae bacterium]